MRIIHCADIHLGSKMEARLPKEKSDERKEEVRLSFHRMVRYAKENDVKVILLSGDVFDSDRPLKKDKEFFYTVVKNNSDIDFLYLRGNHDSRESYTESDIANLKMFTREWTHYLYGNIEICGIEMEEGNASSLYSELNLMKERVNIVMMHGQTDTAEGKDKIHLAKLSGKNIDYLALGHLHSYAEGAIDERGRYAYSGCLEGRGFDECGEKGFVLLEVSDTVKSAFIPHARRMIEEVSVDVGGADSAYQAYQKVKSAIKCSADNLIRVNLTGEVSFYDDTLAKEVEKLLGGDFYFVSVKDRTNRKIDMEKLSGDLSLKGEFLRTVLKSEQYTEEQKQKIIRAGLRELLYGEVE